MMMRSTQTRASHNNGPFSPAPKDLRERYEEQFAAPAQPHCPDLWTELVEARRSGKQGSLCGWLETRSWQQVALVHDCHAVGTAPTPTACGQESEPRVSSSGQPIPRTAIRYQALTYPNGVPSPNGSIMRLHSVKLRCLQNEQRSSRKVVHILGLTGLAHLY